MGPRSLPQRHQRWTSWEGKQFPTSNSSLRPWTSEENRWAGVSQDMRKGLQVFLGDIRDGRVEKQNKFQPQTPHRDLEQVMRIDGLVLGRASISRCNSALPHATHMAQ